ncbi:dipeptidase [Desulforhopalus singaporensis]|uniref:Dipeptidase n=1 Tax=Desulforhopalus singaporensis TaxID=91360 RepID=A0A1H0NAD2_9BACT|nr:C69 family dipeptidase [Desulforhopalus singaporensis]SDO89621.1 Dipeptidase [Desulforhopalus singaporensis]
MNIVKRINVFSLVNLITFTLVIPFNSIFTEACTSMMIGKNATVDGSVILAANDDWSGTPSHLVRVPRKKHNPDETFTLIRGEKIPQVDVTYAYTFASCVYDTGTRKDESWLFGMNENQVAVSMDGVYNFKELSLDGHLLEADDLSLLVLERAKSAREAVRMLGALITKYGFNTSSIYGAEGTVTMAIADPNEGWWFEPVPGGKWIAKKVPDNMASFRPNSFGIHEVDLDDKDNFMMSEDLVDYAIEKGWFDPKENVPFDFAKVYTQRVERGNETDTYNNLRRWRMASLLSGQEQSEDELIYEVVPTKKITVRDAMAVLRDALEGTKYDLSKVPEAGRYGDPFFKGMGDSISRSGTVVSQVVHLRSWMPNEIGGVMWVAFDTPATSVYVPWYAGITETPKGYTIGYAQQYDPASAWWRFQEVGNLSRRQFNKAAEKDVKPVWKKFEDEEFALAGAIEKTALDLYEKSSKEESIQFLNNYSNAQGMKASEMALDLANKLRGKYLDNSVIDW